MMTCGSERSGTASSLACRMLQSAAALAKATPSRTRRRFRAQNSMTRVTMRAPVLAAVPLARLRPRRRLRSAARNTLDGGPQPTLRIDEEVGGGHDCLAVAGALEELHLAEVAGTDLDPARLEAPARVHHEHVLELAGIHDRLRGNDEPLDRVEVERHVREHPGEEPQTRVPELEADLERAAAGRDHRVEE